MCTDWLPQALADLPGCEPLGGRTAQPPMAQGMSKTKVLTRFVSNAGPVSGP